MSQLMRSDMAILLRRQVLLARSLDRLEECHLPLARAAELLIETLRGGGRVLVAGNGGSAAQAEHFAAEMVGRFLCDRAPFAAIALTADTSILTAIANDYGYCEVFARQVAGIGRPGDAFVAMSTSGRFRQHRARCRRSTTVGNPGHLFNWRIPKPAFRLATIAIHAPASETPTIQELHLVMVHHLAEMVEQQLTERDAAGVMLR